MKNEKFVVYPASLCIRGAFFIASVGVYIAKIFCFKKPPL